VSGSDWDARIASFTTVLLGICALAIGYGLLMPSPAAPEPDAQAPAAGYQPLAGPAAPVRLVVPSLKIRAPILPIEVNDQQILDPPRNPHDVGWWKRSARPGVAKGQTVLTGHTVHTGGGVMDNLGDLRKGQVIKVVTPHGTMEYTTTKVITWSKTELAERAVDIFAQQRSDTRLVLITCADWTGSTYMSNTVVFAKPLGVRKKAA
jgi:LPXTG-site transpeptidase (sortase) family protein